MSWTVLLEAAEAIRATAAARDPRVAGLPVAAIGWATVEHERAMGELDPVLLEAGRGGAWTPIERDPALGAQRWQRGVGTAGAERGRPALVVLEPDTEGRLAASLARFGEGVAVVYLGAGSPRPAGALAGALVGGGPAWGPHAVVLGQPEGPGPFDASAR
jgi:hypothetical protein